MADFASKIRSALEAIERSLVKARAAAERIADSLEAEKPLRSEDLESLAAYDGAMRELGTRFGSDGVGLAELRQLERDSTAMSRVRVLMEVEAPAVANLPDIVARVQDALAGSPLPGDLLDVLSAVAALVQGEKLEPDELARVLTSAATITTPAGLVQLVGLAAAGHVRIVDEQDDVAEARPSEHRVDQSPPPSDSSEPLQLASLDREALAVDEAADVVETRSAAGRAPDGPSDEASVREATIDQEVSAASGRSQDAPDEAGGTEEVGQALAALIADRRFGLAASLAEASEGLGALARSLRLVALAGAGEARAAYTGPEVRHELEELATMPDHAFDRPAQLLTLAGALPVTCAASYIGAAQVLEAHLVAVSDEPVLRDFIAEVQRLAERGITINDQVLGALGSVAQREEQLRKLGEDAQQLIEHPPTINYQRASDLLRHQLTSKSASIGFVLDAVSRSDAASVDEVSRLADDFGDRKAASALLDAATETDRKSTKRKPIVGPARERFLGHVGEVAEIGREWSRLMRARERAGEHGWLQDAGSALRDVAKRLVGAPSHHHASGDALVGASYALLADDALALARAVLDGKEPEAADPDSEWRLWGELIRDSEIRLGEGLEPLDALPAERLLALQPAADWSSALLRRAEHGDERETRRLEQMLDAEGTLAPALEQEVRVLLAEASKAVDYRAEQVAADLAARFQRGALSPADWLALSREVSDLGDLRDAPAGDRVHAYADLMARLEAASRQHVAAITDDLLSRARNGGATAEQTARISEALADEDVATAENTILAVERQEPILESEPDRDFFSTIFPELNERLLRGGATASEIASKFERTGRLPGSSGDPVSADRRERAAVGLKALSRISEPAAAGARAVGEVLTLLGLNVERCEPVPATGGWSAFDVSAVIVGRALVPQLGTGAGGRYRVYVVPQAAATEDLLASQLEKLAGGPPKILLHSRPLPVDVLRGLAERARGLAADAQALVCDLTTCIAVAGSLDRGFERTASLTLPFTAINPYNPYLSGVVPTEMFYGRRAELDDLLSADGNLAFVYGGRRLGKSALLRAAEERARWREDLEVCFIDLKDEGVGFPDPPAKVHELLEARFAHVLPSSKKHQPLGRLAEGIASLPTEGPRLLALLDEADLMIDADEGDGFRVLDSLRRMQEDSGRRIRFVFAGLHSVRRFADVPNQRLVQFGRSEAIGALEPEPARALLMTPLSALGYRMDERAVNRILTLTQYQPSLIQLVCDKLLKDQRQRARSLHGPVYEITKADVDNILRQPRLQEEITERFDLTVRLDERYRVIALATAYLAAGESPTQVFEIRQLRDQADFWWPAGFADTSPTEFATLLDEMVGLGVLYRAQQRYGLYSPHVARLLGTESQIIDQLEEAGRQAAPKRTFDGISFRPALPPPRRGAAGQLSPLNMRQVTRLQSAADGILSLIATSALGAGQLDSALSLHLPETDGFELLQGDPDDVQWLIQKVKRPARKRPRIAYVRVAEIEPRALMDALAEVRRALARNETRTSCKALLVIDEFGLRAWRQVIAMPDTAALDMINMRVRKHTTESLASWGRVQNVDLPQFEVAETASEIVRATGGWPELVDKVVVELRRNHDLGAALESVDEHVDDRPGEFLASVGARADPVCATILDGLVELDGEDIAPVDAAEFFADLKGLPLDDAEAAWRVLRAAGVVDVDARGFARVDAVLARALARVSP